MAGTSLDPQDWLDFRAQAHRMLDDLMDQLEHVNEGPVWQPQPPEVRARRHEGLCREGRSLADVHEAFLRDVAPYGVGNRHPGFLGWVHGGGTPYGMLAEMLAGGLNANCGGRDHAPVDVERQVGRWMADLFGFPSTASGLFLTGTSMANLVAVLVARRRALGPAVRTGGLGAAPLVGYASAAVHQCLPRAFDMCGLGSEALRRVAVNDRHEMDLDDLRRRIVEDRASGLRPFFLVGTAGTVDCGAFDPLADAAALAREEGLWFHVDGALGALGQLVPALRARLRGIEAADSLAFDFHKWGQVPYDAGFLLVRDETDSLDTFGGDAAYLRKAMRGLAAGSPWPCDLGPDLSRGFRALKVWVTLQVLGTDRLAAAIEETCRLASWLAARVADEPLLELLAPVPLNIVCFRYRWPDADRLNRAIVEALHEEGLPTPSTTVLGGRLAIRAAVVNHRTREDDLARLLSSVIALGRRLSAAT